VEAGNAEEYHCMQSKVKNLLGLVERQVIRDSALDSNQESTAKSNTTQVVLPHSKMKEILRELHSRARCQLNSE
jgi:hypothetical protein